MTTYNTRPEEVDITPHPRILAMLGEIAFEPHKCIGELIDNAIDGFLNQPRFLQDNARLRPEIVIRVPHKNQIGSDYADIMVEDNGPGMTLAQLTLAAKAGYSGTASLENLGLFGMGFNIATARLGGVTELRSGVRGENAWSILDIDLAALRSRESYIIRPRFENKSVDDSGARVTIRKLKPEQAIQIASGISGATRKSVAGLRSWIGRTYTKYLREAEPRLSGKLLRITVNGEPIRPYRWCVWGENRYVEVGAETRLGQPMRIPAYHHFDDVLGVGYYCASCLSWQPEGISDTGQCYYCHQSAVVERARRMKGWIGIQRHLDEEEYGFDFLRNGRAILQWDKRMFSWSDPETGRTELEYPIDELIKGRHGRILGEIEIDHVPVHYQKDSFEEESWLWREVINNLRGQSPLRHQVTKRLNLPRNDSLLQPIYIGYNRTRTEEGGRYGGSVRGRRDPWSKDLIINQEVAREYYQKFLEGDLDYQSDKKWYEWMVDADRELARQRSKQAESDESEELPSVISSPVATEVVPKTERDRLRERAEVDQKLSGTYGFEPHRVLDVTVYRVRENLFRQQGTINHAVPVIILPELRGSVDCFYDETHPRVAHEEADVQELIIAEVAIILRDRFYDRLPVSFVLDHLRKTQLPELTRDNLIRNAVRLFDEIWPKFVRTFESYSDDNSRRLRELLEKEDVRQLGRMVAEQGRGQERLEEILNTGEFLKWMPDLISRILRQMPERFLDDRLFAISYRDLPEELSEDECTTIGLENVSRVANLLEDAANATKPARFVAPQIERLVRLRAFKSIDLIREYLVAT